MSDRSKVLVELGRIAYISSANRLAEACQACTRAGEEQLAREADFEKCAARRNQLADDLCSGGQARGLQRVLAFDRRLAGLADQQSARLDQAVELHAQASRQMSQSRAETQRELIRLRLAENLLNRRRREGRRRRERKREEECS